MALTSQATAARQGQAKGADAPVATEREDPHPLIDKFGRRHHERVLQSWSPAAIRGLGIRRLAEGDGEAAE